MKLTEVAVYLDCDICFLIRVPCREGFQTWKPEDEDWHLLSPCWMPFLPHSSPSRVPFSSPPDKQMGHFVGNAEMIIVV